MRLRSRVFTVGTVAIVALMTVGLLIATVISGRSSATRVGFVGPAQALAQPFTTTAAALGANVTVLEASSEEQGQSEVRGGQLDVLVSGTPTAPVALVRDQLAPTLQAALEEAVKQQALDAQLTVAGLDPAAVAAQVAGAKVQVQSLQPPNPQRVSEIVVGFAVAYALMFSLSFYGAYVAQGVVEEKSTRIVEIVLATVRPSQLLTSKIVGIGLVGLLQLAVIGVAAFVLVQLTHIVTIPAVGAGAIAVDLVWFVLGFYLYATAFAAGAALVSRQEEIASVTAPPILFLIIAYILVYAVVSEPSTASSVVLSLLPPFAPVIMTFRMATSDVPAWQVLLAMGLTLASAVGMTSLAGRIYANSVLRVGARVTLRDALKGR